MPTALGHFFAGCAVSALPPSAQRSWLLVFLILISALVPDIDLITFRWGTPYEHMFGHRGFTHSISFALIWALLMFGLYRLVTRGDGRKRSGLPFVLLFLSTLTHGLLDAMTTGGLGVGFFAPFSSERYFLPWQFITVSPLRLSAFYSDWGTRVFESEMKYLSLPSLLFILLIQAGRRARRKRRP